MAINNERGKKCLYQNFFPHVEDRKKIWAKRFCRFSGFLEIQQIICSYIFSSTDKIKTEKRPSVFIWAISALTVTPKKWIKIYRHQVCLKLFSYMRYSQFCCWNMLRMKLRTRTDIFQRKWRFVICCVDQTMLNNISMSFSPVMPFRP